MLHLSGYNISMNDLKQFRQADSITPGHPENFATPGIEVSTGPLGQVCAIVQQGPRLINNASHSFVGYLQCGGYGDR